MGQDIVGHCINDILVQNAKPLFFMDYIASSKLDGNKIDDAWQIVYQILKHE